MLESEMDVHLDYEKNSVAGNNSGNSRNGKYPKKIQTEHSESVISIPRDRNGEFEPIVISKVVVFPLKSLLSLSMPKE
jgi:transposase-like protein